MRKEEELPVMNIWGIDFRVHLSELEFRQVDEPLNKISFTNLIDNGDHTILLFDTRTSNGFKGTWKEYMEQPDVKKVRLPSLINLDREGMNEIIRKKGLTSFLARNDMLSIFKNLEVPVSRAAEKDISRRKGRGL